MKAGGERGRQRVRWLDSITNTMDITLIKLREIKNIKRKEKENKNKLREIV